MDAVTDCARYERAEAFFLKAQSVPDAFYYLGGLYSEGYTNGGKPDYQKAVDFYKKAATPDSFFELGDLYRQGLIGQIGGEPDYQTATDYLELAGTSDALYVLGVLFESGDIGQVNGQPNYEKAREYFEKSGTSSAFLRIGILYMEGHIGKVNGQPNYEKAREYFEKEYFEKSLKNAAYAQLGGLYMEGHIGKVNGQRDYGKAREYFEKLIEDLNYKDLVYLSLGKLYMEGHIGQVDGQPNYKRARQYFEASSKDPAYLYLGELYVRGDIGRVNGQPDYEKAKDCFEAAYNKGVASASASLADLYLNGHVGKVGDQPNYECAVKLLEETIKSSEVSNFKAEACYNLGLLYEQRHWGGKDGKPDYQTAQSYFQQASTLDTSYGIIHTLGYDLKLSAAKASVSLIGLYQLECIPSDSLEEKQKKIATAIHEINILLPALLDRDRYFIKGLIEYYVGNWESSLISLQQALVLDSKEEGLIQLIDEISSYLEEKERKKEPLQAVELETIQKDPCILLDSKEEVLLTTDLNEENKPTNLLVGAGVDETSASSLDKLSITIDNGIIRKLTKEEKKAIQSERNRSKFLNTSDSYSKTTSTVQPIELEFLNESQQQSFEMFTESNKKMKELVDNIRWNPWGTAGVGKPEVLKHTFNGYKGCFSRRINDFDRLVYKGKPGKEGKPGKVLILAWEGHYKK